MRGIDLSHHNGDVDMQCVKDAGYDFVILRAGYGRYAKQKDAKFEQNYLNAKRCGLHIGIYWYSYATNAAEALEEAKACCEIIGNKIFDMPVFIDVEEQKTLDKAVEVVDSFCAYMMGQGFFPGVYSSSSMFNSYMPGITNRYCGWVADWRTEERFKKDFTDSYIFWQKTDKGRVTGVNGYVDLDECYNDNLPIYITSQGYNNYPKDEPSKDEHVIEVFIDGKSVFKKNF